MSFSFRRSLMLTAFALTVSFANIGVSLLHAPAAAAMNCRDCHPNDGFPEPKLWPAG